MKTQELYDLAENRVLSDQNLAPYSWFILGDWPEGDAHLHWVLDASRDEILRWALVSE